MVRAFLLQPLDYVLTYRAILGAVHIPKNRTSEERFRRSVAGSHGSFERNDTVCGNACRTSPGHVDFADFGICMGRGLAPD